MTPSSPSLYSFPNPALTQKHSSTPRTRTWHLERLSFKTSHSSMPQCRSSSEARKSSERHRIGIQPSGPMVFSSAVVFLSAPFVLMTSEYLRAVKHPLRKKGKPLQVGETSAPEPSLKPTLNPELYKYGEPAAYKALRVSFDRNEPAKSRCADLGRRVMR